MRLVLRCYSATVKKLSQLILKIKIIFIYIIIYINIII